MYLKETANVLNFLDAVRECKGDVIYRTDEGDRLNLKSVLCCYIFATVAKNAKLRNMSTIDCDEPDDEEKLKPFLE